MRLWSFYTLYLFFFFLIPGKVTVYNFRETVPRKFKTNLLDDCSESFKHTPGNDRIYVGEYA